MEHKNIDLKKAGPDPRLQPLLSYHRVLLEGSQCEYQKNGSLLFRSTRLQTSAKFFFLTKLSWERLGIPLSLSRSAIYYTPRLSCNVYL